MWCAIMLRVILGGLFVSAILAGNFASSGNDRKQGIKISEKADALDYTITGNTFDDKHIAHWKRRNEQYHECGECAFETQPYPGD